MITHIREHGWAGWLARRPPPVAAGGGQFVNGDQIFESNSGIRRGFKCRLPHVSDLLRQFAVNTAHHFRGRMAHEFGHMRDADAVYESVRAVGMPIGVRGKVFQVREFFSEPSESKLNGLFCKWLFRATTK